MKDFYTTEKWTMALYEKRGRAYKEVGVLFDEEMTAVDAFDLFGSSANAIPSFGAVERSLEVEESEPELEKTPEYELRLMNSANRVLATVLWDADSIEACKEDAKSRDLKEYVVTATVVLDEDDDIGAPDEWDWEGLSAMGRINVLDVIPTEVE